MSYSIWGLLAPGKQQVLNICVLNGWMCNYASIVSTTEIFRVFFFPLVLFSLFKQHQASTYLILKQQQKKKRVGGFSNLSFLSGDWWTDVFTFSPFISTLHSKTDCTLIGASVAEAGTAPSKTWQSLFSQQNLSPSVTHPFSTAKITIFFSVRFHMLGINLVGY